VSFTAQLRIPIWREGVVPLERRALMRDPLMRGIGVSRGDGGPVLLIPGFLAGDPSLTAMARWLRDLGHRPCRARMLANVDCTTRAIERLEVSVERLAERHGRRVAIVGQSRGGTFARLLAVRRPDHIDRVICLGSPLLDPMAVHPLVRLQIMAVGALGSAGVEGLFSRSCWVGPCCEKARNQAQEPLAPHIELVSVYSRSDGIVDWRACLDPEARQVEIRASHVGMAVNREAWRVVAETLAARRDAVTDPAARVERADPADPAAAADVA
jgi:triacylglycerol lipase